MAMLLTFALAVLIVVYLIGPARLVRWLKQDMPQASAGTAAEPSPAVPEPVAPDTDEELMERILIGERLAGILSLDDYQREMAVLAAQDEVRHPMAPPPERL